MMKEALRMKKAVTRVRNGIKKGAAIHTRILRI